MSMKQCAFGHLLQMLEQLRRLHAGPRLQERHVSMHRRLLFVVPKDVVLLSLEAGQPHTGSLFLWRRMLARDSIKAQSSFSVNELFSAREIVCAAGHRLFSRSICADGWTQSTTLSNRFPNMASEPPTASSSNYWMSYFKDMTGIGMSGEERAARRNEQECQKCEEWKRDLQATSEFVPHLPFVPVLTARWC